MWNTKNVSESQSVSSGRPGEAARSRKVVAPRSWLKQVLLLPLDLTGWCRPALGRPSSEGRLDPAKPAPASKLFCSDGLLVSNSTLLFEYKCFPIEKRNEKCRNLFSIEFDQLTFIWGIMEYHQETKLMIFVSYLLWWVCLSHDKKLPLISSMHLFNKLIYCNEWNTIFKFDLSKLNLTRSCDYFTIGHWENVYDFIWSVIFYHKLLKGLSD